MGSLLNADRPPLFCPGCAHDRVTQAVDKALDRLGLAGHQVAMVSDIGCSGLFDTFFNTHALHGLHGRALTYATGLKMARPELKVIVSMGDGGLGIGGAHLLSTCRRNIDLTLLILNNFNYGMTGGQCSATTPANAKVASGFLNQLEVPLDACRVACAAGAGYVARVSAYHASLSEQIAAAISFNGFAMLDIWGVCPGRYTRRNTLTPQMIEADMARLPPAQGVVEENRRPEFGSLYQARAAAQPPAAAPHQVTVTHRAPQSGRRELVILGSAGQRIVTAGEILCLAGLTAGLHATQKNDYPITVLRGHSVSEVVLADEKIGYTGIAHPHVIIALTLEGVARRQALFGALRPDALVIANHHLQLPQHAAEQVNIDFKTAKIKSPDWALAALAVLAERRQAIHPAMLHSALALRFAGRVLEKAMDLVARSARLA